MALTRMLTTLLLAVLVAHQAAALNCYACVNPPQSNCADPFNPKDITTIPCTFEHCYTAIIPVPVLNIDITSRGCGDPSSALGDLTNATISTCSSDLCNSAEHPKLNAALMFLLAAAVAIVFSG